MRLFQFPMLTVMVLTLVPVEKGNVIQTHEVGRLGLLMTPGFGILFFACVYSALSYSCILHSKIIYPKVVLCLLVLRRYAKEEEERKRIFPLCRLLFFQSHLPCVTRDALLRKVGLPGAITIH